MNMNFIRETFLNILLLILLASCTSCGGLSGEIKEDKGLEEEVDIVENIEIRHKPETQRLLIKFKAFDSINE